MGFENGPLGLKPLRQFHQRQGSLGLIVPGMEAQPLGGGEGVGPINELGHHQAPQDRAELWGSYSGLDVYSVEMVDSRRGVFDIPSALGLIAILD